MPTTKHQTTGLKEIIKNRNQGETKAWEKLIPNACNKANPNNSPNILKEAIANRLL